MQRDELADYLKADLYRYGGLRSNCYLLKALSPSLQAFRYTYCLRQASLFPKFSIRGLVFRALLNHFSYKYGFQILPNTRIGKGLYIGHRGPVVINGQSELGENCTLSHIVTIGQTNRGERAGCPKIGNHVYIGPGAVIIGKIVIGDNVLVAPNALVNFDVPSDCVVSGNPAVIQQRPDATQGYVNFVLSDQNGS